MGRSRSASRSSSRRSGGGDRATEPRKAGTLGGRLSFAVVAVGMVLLSAAPSAQATFPGANGRIGFASPRDGGDADIFTMNADGSGVAQLTANSAEDRYVAWSADGTKMAFGSTRDGGDDDIFKMNADGSAQTQLTFNSAGDQSPSWSPDGSKIAYVSNQDGDFEIYVMNADGTGQTQLTTHPADDAGPAWSPDGQKIAFQSTRTGNWKIYVMNADGTSQTELPPTGGFQDVAPYWAPDGSKIIFRRDGAGNSAEVYTMNPDGTAQTPITNHPFFDSEGVFSPDGGKIVFSTNRDGDFEMYVMNADGSNQTRITTAAGFDGSHDWQPTTVYARPQGASPIRVALVPAYQECTDPNAKRTGGFSGDACHSPTLVSDQLTVGTPEVNGNPVRSNGFARLATIRGNPLTPADEADIRLEVSITDVRRQGDLSDYTGELGAVTELRITDRGGGPGSDVSTTSVDLPLSFTVPCAATGGAEGAECSTTTSADTLVGGSVAEGRRSIFKAGEIQLFDGGPDGDADTSPNKLFAWQGLFVP